MHFNKDNSDVPNVGDQQIGAEQKKNKSDCDWTKSRKQLKLNTKNKTSDQLSKDAMLVPLHQKWNPNPINTLKSKEKIDTNAI